MQDTQTNWTDGNLLARDIAGPSQSLFDWWVDAVAPCPFAASSGRHARTVRHVRPLYTREERRRRDASPWTMVQAILAPIQFLVFLISLGLVLWTLGTGELYGLATASVVLKTLILYTIMITGSIWEKDVFGRYLFAPAFYWEDMVSMAVLALHTAYLAVVFAGIGTPEEQMALALAAYATYAVNAGQFVLKLRMARLEGAGSQG